MRLPGGASLALCLLGLTAVRLIVAALVPLSPDEAYYWTWSRALAPAYLDHPGMVALWIRIGTLLAGHDPLGVRLVAPFSALAGSLLLAQAGSDLLGLDRRGQVRAVLLLNATLIVGAGAVIMTPDTPLLLFWTATLFCMGRFLRVRRGVWLAAAGVALALAFDSKYTALLLLPPVAITLCRLHGVRALAASATAWIAGLASLAVAAPVVAWNAGHGFASFSKQGGRVFDIHPASALRFVPELIGGQLGLATPLVAIILVAGTVHVTRRARAPGPQLVCLAILVPALVFLVHALGDRVQANWPCVLYPAAALAGAAAPRLRWPAQAFAAATGFALTALVYLQATLQPFPLPARADPIARLDGWGALARAAGSQAARLGLDLAADDYALSAELAWHGASASVLGFDRRWRFTGLPRTAPRRVLLLRSDRRAGPPDPSLFAGAAQVARLARTADGGLAERYTLYRADPLSAATLLPRPFKQL